MGALILGSAIGPAAGISPWRPLFLTITSALRSGPQAGVIVACAPLLSVIVVVTVILLSPHPWIPGDRPSGR